MAARFYALHFFSKEKIKNMETKERDIKNILEDFRLVYFKKYGKQLDDELLYILIRINELNASVIKAFDKDITRLEKKIDELKKEVKHQVSYRTKWDYFVHGLGKSFGYAIVIASAIFAAVCFFTKK
jgi:hypothetical protein